MHCAIEELPVELAAGELVTRYVAWGDMAVRHATVPAGTDMGPVFEGLPGDRCPSDHWGIVLDGAITLYHADGTTEVTRAGELYHWPAGHTAISEDGATFLEIGPVAPMAAFGAHARTKLG